MGRLFVFIALFLYGCGEQHPESVPIDIAELRLESSDVRAALAIYQDACPQIIVKTPALEPICDAIESAFPADPIAFLQDYFVAEEVKRGRASGGFFTGYFEPHLKANRIQVPGYETPIHALPDDLVSVELGAFRPDLEGRRIAGRVEEGRLIPYAARSDIAIGALKDTVDIIAWAADPVELFFLHIQGSGVLNFPDGSKTRIGYAGQNGHIYTAIGRPLIERGEIAKEDMSLEAIVAWLRAHPDEAQELMNQNASYVFFQDRGKDGPFGALGVALTPERALAVDPLHTPYGALVYVETQVPTVGPFKKMLLAADTGGAIRGLGRGDIFFGAGQAARAKASALKAPGRFVIFLPKPPQS